MTSISLEQTSASTLTDFYELVDRIGAITPNEISLIEQELASITVYGGFIDDGPQKGIDDMDKVRDAFSKFERVLLARKKLLKIAAPIARLRMLEKMRLIKELRSYGGA